MDIRVLHSDDEIRGAFPLMSALRDRIRADTFLSEVREQQRQGYELIGGFADGKLLVLAGVRRTHTLSRGPHLFVDDLVTDMSAQGCGHGGEMIAWLAERSRREGLPRIDLDSRITARGFYEKVGFTFHTSIPCWLEL